MAVRDTRLNRFAAIGLTMGLNRDTTGVDSMKDKPGGDESSSLDHLFEVAAQMFAERGFDGVSVREISRASGYSMAAIYHHFRTKEGLFAEVSLHEYEDFASDALARITDYRRRHSKAVSVALAFFDMMTGDKDLFRLLQRDLIIGDGGEQHFRSRPQYQQLIRFIDRLLGFDARDPRSEVRSLSLAALINGYCELAMADHGASGDDSELVLRRYRDALEQFVAEAFDARPE